MLMNPCREYFLKYDSALEGIVLQKKMKVMIYLIAGKLKFDLPMVMPYATHTTCRGEA